jgi:superfamily II DNA/RNA helicase
MDLKLFSLSFHLQVYVHRSGRTARANQSGKTISFVTPEDYEFHQLILEYVTGSKKTSTSNGKGSSSSSSSPSAMIQNYKVESNILPFLKERITLAKKVLSKLFTEYTVSYY